MLCRLPMCVPCDELLAIRHSLLHCSDLFDERDHFLTANSLKVLFRIVSLDCIFKYHKEINIKKSV